MTHGARKDAMSALGSFFEAIGVWSFDHRWLVLIASVLVWGAGGYLSANARIDNSVASFFDTDDPTYGAYLDYRDDFESDEVGYIVYRAPGGAWDLESMRRIEQLTRTLEQEVPFVKEVTSLSNVEFMEGAPPDDILVYDLLADFPESQDALYLIRDKVMKKPLYLGGLVSDDSTLGGVIIEMNRSSVDTVDQLRLDPDGGDSLGNLYPQVSYRAIEAVLARPEYAAFEFFHTGDVALNATYNIVFIEDDLPLLTGLAILVIALSLALVFRRPLGVIGPFMVIVFAMAISLAVIGLLGWQIDFMFGLMPTLLITVGVAVAVHILSEFDIYRRKSGDRRDAIRRSLYLVGPPCLLTSLTTAAGFLSLSLSPVKTVAHLAIYSSAGVLAAFAASVTILVAFLAFGRDGTTEKAKRRLQAQAERAARFGAALRSVASFVIRRRTSILVAWAAVFVVSAWGVTMLTVDSNFLLEFSEDIPVRRTTQFVDDNMSGNYSIVYVFDSGEPDGIKNPAVLREIERVQREAEKHPLVNKTYSIVDMMKDINQSFHNGDPAYYTIPESRELIAQYLLVYEMSGGEELRDYVTMDYARTSLELRCKMKETSLLRGIVEDIDAHLDDEPLQASTVSVTGIGALWLKFVEYITASQIQGALIALTVVSLMMIVVFRSVKIGLLSMIPNIAPVVLIVGFMGWAGIYLDYYRLLIAPVAIGIAVDDTIHLMTRYHYEFSKSQNYEKALYDSMTGVGRALFTTSVILVVGFMVNVFSVMDGQKSFGILLSSVIAVALVADFLLMPALILWLKPFGPEAPNKA
ncbi:MAG: MMPL family transporter [Deltaproteobacteria bacterium]|jgi:predicted RND superfamily exporter protein|nr:MMPL family transporter [Deltaproteobacteria bacterium]